MELLIVQTLIPSQPVMVDEELPAVTRGESHGGIGASVGPNILITRYIPKPLPESTDEELFFAAPPPSGAGGGGPGASVGPELLIVRWLKPQQPVIEDELGVFPQVAFSPIDYDDPSILEITPIYWNPEVFTDDEALGNASNNLSDVENEWIPQRVSVSWTTALIGEDEVFAHLRPAFNEDNFWQPLRVTLAWAPQAFTDDEVGPILTSFAVLEDEPWTALQPSMQLFVPSSSLIFIDDDLSYTHPAPPVGGIKTLTSYMRRERLLGVRQRT